VLKKMPLIPMDTIHIRGARTHNLKNIDLELPRDRADRDHRPVRLGQVVAGVRHHLCRGPAALRRVAVGLCAPVPVDDGKAGRRPHRGAVAGDLDRAEDHQPQPALDRRHHHRDLRLPAPAVRARRHTALPEHGETARGTDRQPDGRPGAGAARGQQADAAGTGDQRAQGRTRYRLDGPG
jgi:hypothetical protein